jgi:hypothetical protein
MISGGAPVVGSETGDHLPTPRILIFNLLLLFRLSAVPPSEIKERDKSPGVTSDSILASNALGFVDMFGAKDVSIFACLQMAGRSKDLYIISRI